MAQLRIQSIEFVDGQITVVFKEQWFQEDIEGHRALLLNHLKHHKIKEITVGADRENTRFEWQQTEFLLNFEYYSQSCWFTAQDSASEKHLHVLYTSLTKNE